MPRLPPPPQFLLPPPPMLSSDIFDLKIISQLTCSSIRQPYQQTTITNSRLILLTSASVVVVAILLFTFTLIWLLSFRKEKQSQKNSNDKPVTSINSMHNLSTYSSRSYETVSSAHTGIYVESVDTSATTCSIDTTAFICIQCYHQHHHQHGIQPAPYYHILSIPDVVPN